MPGMRCQLVLMGMYRWGKRDARARMEEAHTEHGPLGIIDPVRREQATEGSHEITSAIVLDTFSKLCDFTTLTVAGVVSKRKIMEKRIRGD